MNVTMMQATELARTLFRSDISIEAVSPLPLDVALFPEEEWSIRTAAHKRRIEFAAGRYCARRALAKLGVQGMPLPVGIDRAPRWPAGFCGSISHTDNFCVAAVARRGPVQSIGVDAEPDESLDRSLWETVCTPRDLALLGTAAPCERGRLARAIFSAKECTYKAQYPLTGVFLDFHDVEVSVNTTTGRFTATLLRSAGPKIPAGSRIDGRLCAVAGTLVTAIELRNE